MNTKQHQRTKYLQSILRSKSQNHKITKSLNSFTLVEITMAMGIIAIGMVGVMALLPIGFNATRDAIGDNYSADMADQFLHIIAQQAKQDWTTWISDTAAGGKITATKPAIDKLKNTSETSGTAAKGNSVFGDIYYGDGSDGSTSPGVFWVEMGSGNITDFQAVVAIWKSKPRIAVFDTDASVNDWSHTDYGYNKVAALNMEISWPAGKPYTQREKRYYYFELFKP